MRKHTQNFRRYVVEVLKGDAWVWGGKFSDLSAARISAAKRTLQWGAICRVKDRNTGEII